MITAISIFLYTQCTYVCIRMYFCLFILQGDIYLGVGIHLYICIYSVHIPTSAETRKCEHFLSLKLNGIRRYNERGS